MREPFVERISWRRRGVSKPFVGMLHAGDDGIVLAGRDPVSGVEVALSIPLVEVESVHASPPGDPLAPEHCVVLELVDSEAIFLRKIGGDPSHVHALARTLGALIGTSERAIAQGG